MLTSAIDDLNTMYEFYKSGDAEEKDAVEQYDNALSILEEVEFKNMLNSPDDALSCVLQINAGAGGTESCDWASMLERMYMMWAEKHHFKLKELDRTDGDVAGVKSVSIQIDGDYAYGKLKGENPSSSSTGSIMRGCLPSFAKGSLYRCAAKLHG